MRIFNKIFRKVSISVIFILVLTACVNKESQTDDITVMDFEETTDKLTQEVAQNTTQEGTQNTTQEEMREETQNTTQKETRETQSNIETTTQQISETQPATTTQQISEMQPATTTQQISETQPATTAQQYVPTPTQPSTERYVTGYNEQQGQTQRQTKYGVIKDTITIDVYAVYSNGDKEFSYSYTKEVVDTSGYNATDDELKAESEANAIKYKAYAEEVLNLVNKIRAEVGVESLVLDDTLCKAASMRSIEMDYANYFEHRRANGDSCFAVLGYFGISYACAGENIAAGYQTPSQVVEGWKNSEGHYQNMVNSSYKKLGVGYSSDGYGNYGCYWTQLFTN